MLVYVNYICVFLLGYFIADISLYAKDDENDAITYGLDSYGKEICSIGLTSGRLTLKKRLDREVCIKNLRPA